MKNHLEYIVPLAIAIIGGGIWQHLKAQERPSPVPVERRKAADDLAKSIWSGGPVDLPTIRTMDFGPAVTTPATFTTVGESGLRWSAEPAISEPFIIFDVSSSKGPVDPVMTLCPCGIKINMKTGEVVVPPGLSMNQASREFWETMEKLHQQFKR